MNTRPKSFGSDLGEVEVEVCMNYSCVFLLDGGVWKTIIRGRTCSFNGVCKPYSYLHLIVDTATNLLIVRRYLFSRDWQGAFRGVSERAKLIDFIRSIWAATVLALCTHRTHC